MESRAIAHVPARVLFFGGNGHSSARLEPVRAALARLGGGLEIVEVPYPGFEGRPRADTLTGFLDEVERFCGQNPAPAMATGIGGLIALTLRSRNTLPGDLILQGPVLWGLEHRWIPGLLRFGPLRGALPALFGWGPFQRRFRRQHFGPRVDPALVRRFFEGYARCSALSDLFAWFTPAHLRDLERRFADHQEGLERIIVWWGGRDRIVSPREIEWTERALGVRWPLVTFPFWGHYPMMDAPEEWAEALRDALAR